MVIEPNPQQIHFRKKDSNLKIKSKDKIRPVALMERNILSLPRTNLEYKRLMKKQTNDKNHENTILICGDTMVGNPDSFAKKIDDYIDSSITDFLSTSNFRVINLEGPICSKGLKPLLKYGINIHMTKEDFEAIYSKIKPSLVNLANNHIMDYGITGLANTIDTLNEMNIPYIGVGKSTLDMADSFNVVLKNKRICFYSCAENEFANATQFQPGANPYDPLESFDRVKDLKKGSDFLIVLYHGGKEYYRYPTPNLQKICRKFIDSGANLVLCQHSHTIGCEEQYNRGTIVYGTGNFIFPMGNNEYWREGSLISVDVEKEFRIKQSFVIQEKSKYSMANCQESRNILEAQQNRSQEIKVEGFVHTKFEKYSSSLLNRYLLNIYKPFGLRVINKVRGNVVDLHSTNKLLVLYNYLNCEAHSEIIKSALIKIFTEKNDIDK